MRRIARFLLLATLIMSQPVSSVAAAASARLKILTWNMWMMPWFTFQSPHNKARAAAIAAELLQQDFDILCLEKSFDGGARSVLTKALSARYPYRYGPANSGFSLKINSGVWILSRFALSNYHEIQFRECAGIECFSRKGAIMLTGQFEGHRFHIIATHLTGESGSVWTPERQQIRDREMLQIRDELVRRYAEPGVPIFFCGDFDTPRMDKSSPPKESDGYHYMLDTFGRPRNHAESFVTLDDSRARNDLAMTNTGRTDELDYVLVRPNEATLETEWSRLILRRGGWDGSRGRQNLSYRYAVAASIEFK
jgi:hypothetical protein